MDLGTSEPLEIGDKKLEMDQDQELIPFYWNLPIVIGSLKLRKSSNSGVLKSYWVVRGGGSTEIIASALVLFEFEIRDWRQTSKYQVLDNLFILFSKKWITVQVSYSIHILNEYSKSLKMNRYLTYYLFSFPLENWNITLILSQNQIIVIKMYYLDNRIEEQINPVGASDQD